MRIEVSSYVGQDAEFALVTLHECWLGQGRTTEAGCQVVSLTLKRPLFKLSGMLLEYKRSKHC